MTNKKDTGEQKRKVSVALEYVPGEEAPKIIASGKGVLAEKEIAIDQKGYGLRRDGLGSMWFTENDEKVANEMYGNSPARNRTTFRSRCHSNVPASVHCSLFIL